jgi:hypothetical protein
VNRRFSRYAPLRRKIADMRYVFVRTLMMRLVYAGYVMFCHNFVLS